MEEMHAFFVALVANGCHFSYGDWMEYANPERQCQMPVDRNRLLLLVQSGSSTEKPHPIDGWGFPVSAPSAQCPGQKSTACYFRKIIFFRSVNFFPEIPVASNR
jgi:hypothetical protein